MVEQNIDQVAAGALAESPTRNMEEGIVTNPKHTNPSTKIKIVDQQVHLKSSVRGSEKKQTPRFVDSSRKIDEYQSYA